MELLLPVMAIVLAALIDPVAFGATSVKVAALFFQSRIVPPLSARALVDV